MSDPPRIRPLSQHAEMLLHLSQNPDVRVRELAESIGASKKTVQRRLTELERAGLLRRKRKSNYTVYDVPDRFKIEPDSISLANYLSRFRVRPKGD